MFKKIVVVVSVAALATALSFESPAVADEPSDWTLENCVDAAGNPTTKIASGAQCDLKNRKNGLCLMQTSNTGQADWDFFTCSSKTRNAKLTAKDAGALNCGETFALKLGTEYFRKCKSPQLLGINVCSETASAPQQMHFDWQIQGCSGQVETGKPVSLFNVARGDSVVYALRASKIVNTCWADKAKAGVCTNPRRDIN